MGFTLQEFFKDCATTIKPALFISLTFMSQALIITTDIMMLGWMGIEMLAAAGYTVRLYMPLFLLVLGTALAIMVMAGRCMGAKQYDNLRLVVRKLLLMGFVMGTVCSFVLILSVRPLLIFLGHDELFIKMAEGYSLFLAFSLPFAIFTAGVRNFMTVAGKTAPFMYVSFGMILLNAFLNYGFGFGNFGLPELGIQGIGMSSTVVNAVNTIMLIVMCKYMGVYSRFQIFENTGAKQIYKTIELLRIAIPLSTKLVLETIFYSIGFFIIGSFGAEYLAGYQIVYQIDTNIFLFGIGASSVITSRVAYNMGAKNITGIKMSALSGIFVLAIWSVIAGIIAYVYGDDIARFFITGTDNESIKTRSIIVKMLFILMLYQAFHGMSLGFASAIDGMGQTVQTMKSFVFSTVAIGIPISFILPYYTHLGAIGVLYATGLALFLNVMLMVPIWIRSVSILEQTMQSDDKFKKEISKYDKF